MVNRPGWAPVEVGLSRPSGARNVLAVMPDLPLRLLEPGLVRVPLWHPEDPHDVPHDVDGYPGCAGSGCRR